MSFSLPVSVVNMCQDNDVDQRNPEGADDTVERTPPAGVNNTEQNQRPVVSVPSDASSTNSNENEPQEVVIKLKIQLQPSCCRHCLHRNDH